MSAASTREVTLRVNGAPVRVAEGSMVVAAIHAAGAAASRRSVRGEPRGALCGMGVCFECRATVDGREQVRTCVLPVVAGMEVRTHG
ncbi:(2Fe-2S)-binding protein [Luteimonas sp. A478]